MNVVVLAICFLLFCTLPHRHAPKLDTSCDKIASAYAGQTGSRDDFVKSFKVSRQHHVLECIGDAK